LGEEREKRSRVWRGSRFTSSGLRPAEIRPAYSPVPTDEGQRAELAEEDSMHLNWLTSRSAPPFEFASIREIRIKVFALKTVRVFGVVRG
jgi:hypothetical protein